MPQSHSSHIILCIHIHGTVTDPWCSSNSYAYISYDNDWSVEKGIGSTQSSLDWSVNKRLCVVILPVLLGYTGQTHSETA